MRRLLRLVFATLAATFIAGSANAAALMVEGTVPADPHTDRFQLVVSALFVTQEELDAGAVDPDDFASRFAISFPDVDAAPLAFTAEEGATHAAKFYLAKVDGPFAEMGCCGRYKVTYTIDFVEAVPGEMTARLAARQLNRASFTFKLGGATLIDQVEYPLEPAPEG